MLGAAPDVPKNGVIRERSPFCSRSGDWAMIALDWIFIDLFPSYPFPFQGKGRSSVLHENSAERNTYREIMTVSPRLLGVLKGPLFVEMTTQAPIMPRSSPPSGGCR